MTVHLLLVYFYLWRPCFKLKPQLAIFCSKREEKCQVLVWRWWRWQQDERINHGEEKTGTLTEPSCGGGTLITSFPVIYNRAPVLRTLNHRASGKVSDCASLTCKMGIKRPVLQIYMESSTKSIGKSYQQKAFTEPSEGAFHWPGVQTPQYYTHREHEDRFHHFNPQVASSTTEKKQY